MRIIEVHDKDTYTTFREIPRYSWFEAEKCSGIFVKITEEHGCRPTDANALRLDPDLRITRLIVPGQRVTLEV